MTDPKKENPFDNLKVTKDKMRESLDWFMHKVKALNKSKYTTKALLQQNSRLVANPVPGRMYLYKYSPVHAETLKYYDVSPLIFYLNKHPDPNKSKSHFYGISLHYLPPNIRLALLKKLYDITNNTRFDATTRIRTSWKLLTQISTANNLGIQNCIKMYRVDAMESRFLEIPSSSWPMVAMLPIHNFKKASAQAVWRDSKRNL